MKKRLCWLIVCALLALSACRGRPAVNLAVKNANGTPAVNLPASPAKSAAAPAPSAALPPAPEASSAPGTGAAQNAPAPSAAPPPVPEASSAAQNKHEIPETPLSEPGDDGIIEIREKMFIAQTNEIYFNAEDYLGKTLSYEGMFDVYEVPETGVKYYSVFRYGPGCCGIDANAGFEVMWDKPYPEPNDWVRAEGVLEEYDEDGYKYLRLALTSLEVLPTRGAEYVSQ